MPPEKEGEVRELGSTITPNILPFYRQSRQKWLEDKRGNWSRESQVEILSDTVAKLTDLGLTIPQVIENISKYIGIQPHNTIGPTRHMKRGDHILASDIPVLDVQEGIVGNDDPRVSLRGNKKIVAKHDLPRCHVVGVHRGVVRMEEEHKLFATPPSTEKGFGQFRNSSSVLEWERHVESFTWADPDSDYSVEGRDGQKAPLYNCSVGYGNLCCLANDPKILTLFLDRENSDDQQQLTDEERNERDAMLYDECESVAGGGNCTMFPALIRGFPHIFFITTKEIPQGAELLYEYQASYWTIQNDIRHELDLASDQPTESQVSLPLFEMMDVEGVSLKVGTLALLEVDDDILSKPKRDPIIYKEPNRHRPPPSDSLDALVQVNKKKQRRF